ncbi:MAG: SRPBCC domain-containing protein [Pseudomonadota bacterium]
MNIKLAVIEGHGDLCRMTLRTQFSADIQAVWRVITQVDQLKIWWPDWQPGGVLEPFERGRVVLGDGRWIDGEVKVWAPPHVLAFSWREDTAGGDWFEAHTKSLLTIQLLQINSTQIELTLFQYAPRDSIVGGIAGWHYFAGERLKSLLESEAFDDRAERFDELVALYEEGHGN